MSTKIVIDKKFFDSECMPEDRKEDLQRVKNLGIVTKVLEQLHPIELATSNEDDKHPVKLIKKLSPTEANPDITRNRPVSPKKPVDTSTSETTRAVVTPLGNVSVSELKAIQVLWTNCEGTELEYTAFCVVEGEENATDLQTQCKAALSAMEKAAGDNEAAKKMLYTQLWNINKTNTEGEYCVRSADSQSTAPEIVLKNLNDDLQRFFELRPAFQPRHHAQINGLVQNAVDSVRAVTPRSRRKDRLAKSKQVAKSQPSGFRMSATPTSPLDQLKRDLEKAAGTGFFSNQLEKLTKCVQGKKDKLKHEEKELLVRVSEHLKELGEYHTDMRKKYSETHSEKLGRIAEFLDACKESDLPLFLFPRRVNKENLNNFATLNPHKPFQSIVNEDIRPIETIEIDNKTIGIHPRLYVEYKRMRSEIYVVSNGVSDHVFDGENIGQEIGSLENGGTNEKIKEIIHPRAYRLHTALKSLPSLNKCKDNQGRETVDPVIQVALSQEGFGAAAAVHCGMITKMCPESLDFFVIPQLVCTEQVVSETSEGIVIEWKAKSTVSYYSGDGVKLAGYVNGNSKCVLSRDDSGNWNETWTLDSPVFGFANSVGQYDDFWFLSPEDTKGWFYQTDEIYKEKLIKIRSKSKL